MRRSVSMIVALAATCFMACGFEGSVAQTCAGDLDCARGLICLNSTCQSVDCDGSGDCPEDMGDQICITAAGMDGGVCSGVECGDGTALCPQGQICVDFLCQPGEPAGCTVDGACNDTEVCDEGSCRPCVGDECGPTVFDCTTDGCPAGQVCNETTKACDSPIVASGDACTVCGDESDCPDGWACNPLATGKACLPPCDTDDQCMTGWSCQGGSCAPAGYKCEGCVTDGCPAGTVCDTINRVCAAQRLACEPCTYGWECGPEGSCIKEAPGVKLCKPRCTGDAACPASSICEADNDSGVQVCVSTGTTCCYDADPANCGGDDPLACDPVCAGTTPFCVEGACQQCKNDTHCGQDETCNAAGYCEGAGQTCAAPTPYFYDGACVECLNNGHCPANTTCSSQTKSCEEPGDVCGTCVAPYPACTEVAGEFYCVQCTGDEHCGVDGTCNVETFSCQGGTVTPTDACESDADCDPGITGYDLACDAGTGYCYDKNGQCDDITAYCKGGGACLDLFEALMGGGGMPGGIPGMPGGGATMPGFCECDPAAELMGAGVCGNSMCLPLGALMGGGAGGSICFSF